MFKNAYSISLYNSPKETLSINRRERNSVEYYKNEWTMSTLKKTHDSHEYDVEWKKLDTNGDM